MSSGAAVAFNKLTRVEPNLNTADSSSSKWTGNSKTRA